MAALNKFAVAAYAAAFIVAVTALTTIPAYALDFAP